MDTALVEASAGESLVYYDQLVVSSYSPADCHILGMAVEYSDLEASRTVRCAEVAWPFHGRAHVAVSGVGSLRSSL